MEKKSPFLLPLGIFLIFFLVIFLIREINLTGKVTGTIIIKNNAPILTSDPVINSSSPNTINVIRCLPGNYFDPDNHPKYKDYWKWYRNNLLILFQFSQDLNLGLAGTGDEGDVIRCTHITSDGFSNSTARNSSAVTITALSTPPPGGGGGGSTTTILNCISNYYCSPWSDCINNIQTRECIDLNRCDPVPQTETRECQSQISGGIATSTILIQLPGIVEEAIPTYSLAIITSILAILILLLVIAVILSRIYPKKKKIESSTELRKAKTELYRYIKQALDLGYTPDQIKESLVKAGWPKSMIDSALNDIT